MTSLDNKATPLVPLEIRLDSKTLAIGHHEAEISNGTKQERVKTAEISAYLLKKLSEL